MAESKILIIEDERPMANILAMKLKTEGFESDVVYNGKEGLEALQKNTYDLIILDLVMPHTDGFTFLSKAQNFNTAPVVVITNLGQESEKKRALELGATEYLVKTEVNLQTIISTVKRILSSS